MNEIAFRILNKKQIWIFNFKKILFQNAKNRKNNVTKTNFILKFQQFKLWHVNSYKLNKRFKSPAWRPKMKQTNSKNPNNIAKATKLDLPIAIIVLGVLLPIVAVNALIALSTGCKVLSTRYKVDALGRPTRVFTFTRGFLRNSAALFNVVAKDLHICGLPLSQCLTVGEQKSIAEKYNVGAGIYSLVDVCRLSGLAVKNEKSLIEAQLQFGLLNYVTLVARAVFCQLFYSSNKMSRPEAFQLFGFNINNVSLAKATDWVLSKNANKQVQAIGLDTPTPNVAFFVNAHSINSAAKNASLKAALHEADQLFADGSGMRLAARKKNIAVKDNVNGTDMLPLLCEKAAQEHKRLFFLGAKPGVAVKAAKALKQKHPLLDVTGCHHGFFDEDMSAKLVDEINLLNTDVLLVALGSPKQEQWVINNKHKLKCHSVIAVGGLFDYYSGDIARAPIWMREMGLEWIWRLMQEPITKFQRYVLGTPEFLARTFLLNQANRGV